MITILPRTEADFIIFEAKDKDEVLASLKANISSDKFVLSALTGDEFMYDGLFRAAMNYADNRGIRKAYFNDMEVIRKLGYFIFDDYVDISKTLNGCKSCENCNKKCDSRF